MELAEATEAVIQILNEECLRPTIRYEDVAHLWVLRYQEMNASEVAAWTKISSLPRKNLPAQRQDRPRLVTEAPQIYQFSGTNFDLLMSVYASLEESQRSELIEHVLERVECGGTRVFPKPDHYAFPTVDGEVCELPLIAEFCIRTGNIEQFFAAAAKPAMPTYSLAIMVLHLEEIIALSWDLFSKEQLRTIPAWLAPLRLTADRQTHSARGVQGGPMVKNPYYRPGHERVAKKIIESIDGISQECEQARFFYLKGALQRTVNLEVESDKAKVEGYLATLGFSNDMIKALNAAENDYRSTTNPFELKSCLGHIRSFLEHLHREAARSIAAAAGATVVDRWGDVTIFLRQQGYFTREHEEFITSLYKLISDTSVHPLGAEREYARLLRNVVIEYGVMFLTTLAKKGVKVT